MRAFSASGNEEALSLLNEAKIQFVHIGLFDDYGMLRERRLGLEHAQRAFEGRLTFPNVLLRWDAADNLLADAAISSEPLEIDPSSGRLYPFEEDAALFVADYGGPSRETSPRSILRTQVEKCAGLGFEVRAAFEFELIFLQETDVSLREQGFRDPQPIALENKCWSGTSAAQNADLLRELQSVMSTTDIPLYCLGLELGPGCVEATLDASAPLRAADNAALFKVFTKAFARRQDLTASFMAKLGDSYPGLSGHINLSLRHKDSNEPAFHDVNSSDGIGPLMRHFIGGVTGLLPEVMVMSNSTVNSFRRMTPGTWAPRTASWGFDNYTSAIRVIADSPETTRLEYRIPGSDTHPHLALASVLGAGLWGIESRTEPTDPVSQDAREGAPVSGPQLPRNLLEASEKFLASSTARKLFGDTFVSRFGNARIGEEIAFRSHVSAFERARYMEIV